MTITALIPARHVRALLNVSPVTLWRWREAGTGPRWCKMGARVLYDAADVERFVENSFAHEAPTPIAA